VLVYKTLEYAAADDMSLVEICLITGRPHQIRAQFAFVGHPVAGDRKYGRDGGVRPAFGAQSGLGAAGRLGARLAAQEGQPLQWPALWAARLEFEHPSKRETVSLRSAPPQERPWTCFGARRE
jgi:23S rRNA pseudouridine1911/1915/1917 synthase